MKPGCSSSKDKPGNLAYLVHEERAQYDLWLKIILGSTLVPIFLGILIYQNNKISQDIMDTQNKIMKENAKNSAEMAVATILLPFMVKGTPEEVKKAHYLISQENTAMGNISKSMLLKFNYRLIQDSLLVEILSDSVLHLYFPDIKK